MWQERYTVYQSKLKDAGFEQISIEPTRVYTAEDAREFLIGAGIKVEKVAQVIEVRHSFSRHKKLGWTDNASAPVSATTVILPLDWPLSFSVMTHPPVDDAKLGRNYPEAQR